MSFSGFAVDVFLPWRMAANSHVLITGLFVYPIKSCRAVVLEEAEFGLRGIAHDREFLVVDESGMFLTQRNTPELATVQIALEENGLVLKANQEAELRLPFTIAEGRSGSRGVRKVTIFNDQVLADDAGDEAADWFTAVVGRPARLVQIGAASSRKVPAQRAKSEPEISFTDAFPTLLVAEESLADLNTRLPQPIPMTRFRPNIVVRGGEPYAENTWSSVRAGDLVFGCATTCLRCVITSIDQQTGAGQGAEPLRTLATYRRAPEGNGVIFGEYLVHSGPGKLRVGDSLTIESGPA